MANIRPSDAARNAILQAIADLLNAGSGGGTLKLYTGAQPATGDTAVTTQTLLATLTFSNPAEESIADGLMTFDVIAEDSSADADGSATWGRMQDSDGNHVIDGDVGTIDDDDALIQLNTTTIVAGGPVRMNEFFLDVPESIEF